MPSNESKEERKGRDNELLSEEERTPKRLKHMEPDLTVVVGGGDDGVEFHHYSVLLCNSCPFFENMLSSTMQESEQMRIEFPDKNPKEWLEVYRFLDPSSKHDDPQQPLAALITPENAVRLASWFEYLGLDSLVKVCDRVEEKDFYELFKESQGGYVTYSGWCDLKLLSMPRTQKLYLAGMKYMLPFLAQQMEVYDAVDRQKVIEDLQNFVLDEHLVSVVNFPEHMLENMDREAIVSNPLFQYILENAAKDVVLADDREEVFLRENKPLEDGA